MLPTAEGIGTSEAVQGRNMYEVELWDPDTQYANMWSKHFVTGSQIGYYILV